MSGQAEKIETVTFANKKKTIPFTGLTPLTEYTFTVTVLTSDDVPSQTVSEKFSQGLDLVT